MKPGDDVRVAWGRVAVREVCVNGWTSRTRGRGARITHATQPHLRTKLAARPLRRHDHRRRNRQSVRASWPRQQLPDLPLVVSEPRAGERHVRGAAAAPHGPLQVQPELRGALRAVRADPLRPVARALGCVECAAPLPCSGSSASKPPVCDRARTHLSRGAALDAALAEQLARDGARDSRVSRLRTAQADECRVLDRHRRRRQDLSARRTRAGDLLSQAASLRTLDARGDGGRARAAAARGVAIGARGAVPVLAGGREHRMRCRWVAEAAEGCTAA